ncbi:prevent-host-death family protein [Paraburkholderia sp. BL6669N2]|uniref:type II toxin-antitoxin system Phd/YefM family antitoxin n=1 Tax=Paraburkholderia sp. BL6669N2 TaxID=1938807 RepID=UPI000E234FE0|nr:type II toxin-antitoxin system Phd/YefM family antitoxin [Paraburkholderia sp. BL6669N2]REG48423.1 prevent-host-death family protein [Paraburkholderia sp. BL6669N2]
MHIYNIHEAKTNLSRLIEETVNGGEPFVIAKAGKPLVKVMRVDAEASKPLRRIGFLKGQIKVPADFDTMAADEICEMFQGKTT